MSNVTQIDEVDILTVWIDERNDWATDDIETVDDCDDAFVRLTQIIVSIEHQMDQAALSGNDKTDHYFRMKGALRWKKAALQIVQSIRGRIVRNERREERRQQQRHVGIAFLEIVKSEFPDVFGQVIDRAVKASDGVTQ